MGDKSERSAGGMTFDHVRRSNLSTTLKLVHYGRQATRPEITTKTGLNRSTVIALANELRTLGLVIDVDIEKTEARGKGRPSTPLRPEPSIVSLAVNPEIDAVTCALVGLGGRVLARSRTETRYVPTAEQSADIAAVSLTRFLSAQGDRYQPVGVGMAVPGLVHTADGVVRTSPHLGWSDEPVGAQLSERMQLPSAVGNDASAGSFAELMFGAGRGYEDIVYFNGSESGIGGGIVLGGKPVTGRSGYAGQLGYNLLSPPAGAAGRTTGRSFDDEVNRRALVKTLGLRDVDDDELEAALEASSSDVVSRTVRHQIGVLSLAIATTVNLLNPQAVILGGFLGLLLKEDPGYLTTLVRRQSLGPNFSDIRIMRASLGSNAVMIGAAELAFGPLLEQPDAFDLTLEKLA